MRLSGPRSRPTTTQKIWQRRKSQMEKRATVRTETSVRTAHWHYFAAWMHESLLLVYLSNSYESGVCSQ
jgi:hypothetical protein